MLVRPGFESLVHHFYFLFLNFNTIFQIITLGPFKFNFQSHTFFWEKGHKILLVLGHHPDGTVGKTEVSVGCLVGVSSSLFCSPVTTQ
ncbi:hypothetical protein Hanom_Chr10g00929581 [Helianthus anomalus]